jgi:2-isopropylmalate synthase
VRYEITSIEFKSGTEVAPWARVTVRIDGKDCTAEAGGNGPVNAVVQALKHCTGEEVQIDEYHIDALSGGSDAQGKVSMAVSGDNLVSRGQATDMDVVIASAKAFIAALNHRAYQIELSRLAPVANG